MEENTRSAKRRGQRRRRLRRLGNALLAFAVVAAAYPWLTGAYTWLQQRAMLSGFGRFPPSVGSSAEDRSRRGLAAGPDMEMGGWPREDAAYWKGLEPGEAFGRLRISSAGIDIVVVKGVSRSNLKRGPGWLPDTALPGEIGNVGMSGHRTTFLAPFRHLDKVSIGDRIELESPFRLYVYRVVKQWTVLPEEGHVMAPTEAPMLTLTTCHPPFSDRKRLVVRARLERVVRTQESSLDQGE